MWTIILNIMTVVGFIVTILSLVVGIMALTKQKLLYYSSSINLIEKNKGTPKELKLFYYEDEIPRLTRTTFTLFKKGHKTILGEKILEEDPLRLEFATDAKILDYSILKATREVNKFEIKKTADNVLKINFKFLDSNDGISLTVLHTGDNTIPNLTGTIMGLPEEGLYDYRMYGRRLFDNKVFNIFLNFYGVISGIIFVFYAFFFEEQNKNLFTDTVVFFISIGFISCLMLQKYYPIIVRPKIPQKLRSDNLNF